jgi:hypothetical protein
MQSATNRAARSREVTVSLRRSPGDGHRCNRPGRPPVNPKLCKHSNFFEPAKIWNLQTDERIAKYKPKGLKYDAHLPVGQAES